MSQPLSPMVEPPSACCAWTYDGTGVVVVCGRDSGHSDHHRGERAHAEFYTWHPAITRHERRQGA